MVLCPIKHGAKWDFNATIFSIKGPTFERMIVPLIDKVLPTLFEVCVEKCFWSYSMMRMVADNVLFKFHKYDRYATDVTFHHANRPAGNHQESKHYFSNKHKIYGYKTEVSVVPNGLAIGCIDHRQRSVADVVIIRKNNR